MSEIVYLGLGSNMGDKLHYLSEAVRLLSEHEKIQLLKVSKYYQTSPVGGVEQDDFVNIALKISTKLEALELLKIINQIEQELDRVRLIHWGPRTIDIDILFFGEQIINEEKLTVPHPEIFNRLFVLVPLLEIADESLTYFTQIKSAIQKLEETSQKIIPLT